MGETALACRAREAGLDRLDDARRTVGDHQKGITKAAAAHVLKEHTDRLGILLGAGHEVQQHRGAACGEAPGRQDRFPLLTGPDAFGNAVDEQVGDVVFAQVPACKLLVVRPQPLADLRDRRA